MNDLLLDTHAFLWFAIGDDLLTVAAHDAITQATTVYVSAASAWEMRTKYRLGKLSAAAAIAHDLPDALRRLAFTELPISFADGDLAGSLVGEHCDPFDRMLVAQALNHNLTLISNEAVFDQFGVTRIW